MKPSLVLSLALAASLTACASTPTASAGQPAASQAKKEAPLLVGPDIIAEVPVADAWALISDVDHWSDWNSRLTGVTHTAALAEGAAFTYKDGGKAVDATLLTLASQDQLVWEGATTGKHVRLHWSLKAMDAQRTLVSLRAELKASASSETVGQAGAETSSWVGAVQSALAKKAEALKAAAPAPAPAPKKKKHHSAPAAAQAQ